MEGNFVAVDPSANSVSLLVGLVQKTPLDFNQKLKSKDPTQWQ